MRMRLLIEFIGMLVREVEHGTLFTSMRLTLSSLFSADAIQFSLALLFNIAVFNTFSTK